MARNSSDAIVSATIMDSNFDDRASEAFRTGEGVGRNVRRFYEDLITDGKLREAMMVVVVQPDPLVPMWSCSLCDWRNAPSHYTYCPGCGNKIKR